MAKSSSFKLYLAISMSLACISLANAIIDGTVTTVTTYPYVLSMRVSGKVVCTAILVGTKSALTACDCFDGVTDLTIVIMRGGQNRLNNANEGVRRGVSAVYKPANYVKNTGMMNIAIAQLRQPMTGPNIAVVPFGMTRPTTTMAIAGWGPQVASFTNPSQMLRMASMQVYPSANCTAQYGTRFNSQQMICIWSSPTGTKTACQVDQGGPGVLSNSLVAVMSFTDNCVGSKPYVCTDVTNAVVKKQIDDWIALAQA